MQTEENRVSIVDSFCSREPGTQRVSNHTKAKYLFVWFFLLVFRQAGPPQRVDCLAQMMNKREVSFPRTQRRIILDELQL